jgi:hypothetical protein
MNKYLCRVTSLVIFITSPLWATSTGLNNIPTADVVPERVLVFQVFSNLANNNKPDHFAGFKYGPAKNIEIGLDGRIFPEKAKEETLVGQTKMRLEFTHELAAAFGILNLGDRASAGDEAPFAVLSYDIGFMRAHFGGTTQNHNEGFFAGLDKTIKLFNRDFTLRSDILQTNDQRDTTSSVGFIYDLGHNFLVESWMSFPTQSGQEDVVTIKLDYVIEF